MEGLWFSIAQIDTAQAQESDPLIRQRLLIDRSLFAIRARDKEIEWNLQRANANALYDELGVASANYDQAVASLQGQVQAIDQQITTADQALAKANRRIRGLQAEPKVSNAVVGTIDATARALTSYDPFPADLLQQRFRAQLRGTSK